MTRGEAKAFRAKVERAAYAVQDDAESLELIELFPAYRVGVAYAVGDRIRYGGNLYRVVQAHTSQADWGPDATPALYTVVSVEEWPEWVQPAGAHDAYATGAKVKHNGKRWVSEIDANVWEPGVCYWQEVTA